MNQNIFHNWAHDGVHHWAHHRKGSIMIWTVMLGFVLTSVFFFFGMRQRMMVIAQRDTAEIQNAKMELESLAEYLQAHTPSSPSGLNATIDGIQVLLTQNADEIVSTVDIDETKTYTFSGSIFIEWDDCMNNMQATLIVNDVAYDHDLNDICLSNKPGYDDLIGPISVTNSFTIKTLNAPSFFRIKPQAGTTLVDNQWHMELTKELEYGKKIIVHRTF